MAFNYPLLKTLTLLLLVIILAGCYPKAAEFYPQTPPPEAVETPAFLTPETQTSPVIWIDPLLPTALRNAIKIPPEIQLVSEEKSANVKITYSADYPVSHWYYALVAPYPTLNDHIEGTELMQYWQNHDSEFPAEKLLLDSGTLNFFSRLWGYPDSESIQVIDTDKMLDLAWSEGSILGYTSV